ncbi:exosome complex RNA-binding protein Csl4 [Candidatus Micrarchaeota archaeon]|nr:exosome complex RNA-binding protein Csl4 [Candidatus Micrarchaeota archaeon]
MDDNPFTTPGTQLAVVEEFEPGFGAIEENGLVFATIPGLAKTAEHHATVTNPKAIQHLQRGDLVYAVVRDVYDSIALLEFQSVQPRAAFGTYGYIRIANVQRGYTENFRDVFRIGDFVKAKIHEVKPLGIYLTMAESGLGVVRAFCASCREEISFNETGMDMRCNACGRRQSRKLANAPQGQRPPRRFDRDRRPPFRSR